jgi:hypothetical protein
VIAVHFLPAYWGVETDPVDRSFVTRATLHEILPPYRISDWAFRVRVSPRHWVHFGRYHYDSTLGRYGLVVEPTDIAEWRGPRAQAQGEDTDADAYPA